MRAEALHRLGVLVRHNAILRLRDPGHLVSYLVMPMVLMVVFKPLYASAIANGAAQVTIGMLVMFSVLALSIVGTSILTERTWGTWDRLRATPASAAEMLLGKGIPIFGILVVQQVVLIVFGSQVVGMRVAGSPALIGFAVAVWGFALLAIGSLLATVVRGHGELAAVCDVGSLAVSALGGALTPVALMPHWAQQVAPLSPGYWAMTMLQAAVDGRTGDVLPPAAVLCGVGALAGSVACVRLNRGLSRFRG